MNRDERGRFTEGNAYASMGGRVRAERLTPARRQAIARAGWQGLVEHRFHGDEAAAAAWLGALGAWAVERAAFGGSVIFQPVYEYPGGL